jgi:hypothetical protein
MGLYIPTLEITLKQQPVASGRCQENVTLFITIGGPIRSDKNGLVVGIVT